MKKEENNNKLQKKLELYLFDSTFRVGVEWWSEESINK